MRRGWRGGGRRGVCVLGLVGRKGKHRGKVMEVIGLFGRVFWRFFGGGMSVAWVEMDGKWDGY